MIETEAEAVAHGRVVAQHLLGETKKAVMPDQIDKAFNEWADQAAEAAGIRPEPDAEISEMAVAAIKGDTSKLPLAERMSLVEALLAQNRSEIIGAPA